MKSKMKTKNKKPSEGDELLAEVIRYYRGIEPYNFALRLSGAARHYATVEAWEELESKIENRLNKVGIKL